MHVYLLIILQCHQDHFLATAAQPAAGFIFAQGIAVSILTNPSALLCLPHCMYGPCNVWSMLEASCQAAEHAAFEVVKHLGVQLVTMRRHDADDYDHGYGHRYNHGYGRGYYGDEHGHYHHSGGAAAASGRHLLGNLYYYGYHNYHEPRAAAAAAAASGGDGTAAAAAARSGVL